MNFAKLPHFVSAVELRNGETIVAFDVSAARFYTVLTARSPGGPGTQLHTHPQGQGPHTCDEEDGRSARRMSTVASVTSDGDFAHVQFGCGQVICKRDRIIVVATDCQLAATGGRDIVTVAVSQQGGRA